MTSYLGPSLNKYSSFIVSRESSIRQIIVEENNIISLVENAIHFHTKGGIRLNKIEDDFKDLYSMTFVDQQKNVLAFAGAQKKLNLLNLNDNSIENVYQMNLTIFRSSFPLELEY